MKKLLLLSITAICAAVDQLKTFKASEKAPQIKDVKKPQPLANKSNYTQIDADSATMSPDSPKPKWGAMAR